MKKRSIQKSTFLPAIMIFFIMNPCFGFAEIYPAKITIPMISSAPEIDGKIEERAWEECQRMSDFVEWTLDAYTGNPLTVLLGFDKNNLYVSFENSDPDATSLIEDVPDKRLHDTFLWGRNFNRITLSNQEISLALMGDPKGTMADWKDGDMSWNGTWSFAASIGKDSWTAEFRIPFSELGMGSPPLDEKWSLGIIRSFPKGESASWSGECSFTADLNSTFRFGEWPQPVPGRNSISFEGHNSGEENLEIICDLELIPFRGEPQFINQKGQGSSSDMDLLLRGKPLRYTYRISLPPGSQKKELYYDLPEEGSYYASSTCRKSSGEVLLRNRGFWFVLEPNSEKLREIRKRLGEGMAALSGKNKPVKESLKAESEELQKTHDSLREEVAVAWNNKKWEKLSNRIDDHEIRVNQFVHRVRYASLSDWQGRPAFGVAMAHSILKLPRDEPFPGKLSNQITISAAGNEYESFQLVILPFGSELSGLEIEVGDLVNDKGIRIAGKNIEVSKVGYNHIDWQADYVASKGWHPDPLLPYTDPVSIPGTTLCQPFWITVYIPPGSPAGDYRGKISVSLPGEGREEVNIKLRVWDFELAGESHLKTHSWDNTEYLAGFYNMDEFPLEWYLRFCGLLLKNRMNPGSAGTNYISQSPDAEGNYDFSRVEKILEYCLERGLSRFSIIQLKKGPYEPEEAEQVFDFIEAYAQFLRERGWMDKALIELWDEPTSLEWEGVKRRAERIRNIDPGLRLQLFAEGGPYAFWEDQSKEYGLRNLIDIWAPWRIVESPKTQASGDEIWTYFCTLARGNAPNFYIDRPAIYQRLIPWYCWMYGVDGFEHWSTTYFWRNVLEGKPMSEKWPNTGWDSRTYHHYNGEGQLIYPGPDGRPLPSMRLEIFRDGMEDYEYMHLLNEILKEEVDEGKYRDVRQARQLLNIEGYMLKKYPMEVASTQENTIRYPGQPERILEAREKIAEAIETLRKQ